MRLETLMHRVPRRKPIVRNDTSAVRAMPKSMSVLTSPPSKINKRSGTIAKNNQSSTRAQNNMDDLNGSWYERAAMS